MYLHFLAIYFSRFCNFSLLYPTHSYVRKMNTLSWWRDNSQIILKSFICQNCIHLFVLLVNMTNTVAHVINFGKWFLCTLFPFTSQQHVMHRRTSLYSWTEDVVSGCLSQITTRIVYAWGTCAWGFCYGLSFLQFATSYIISLVLVSMYSELYHI